MTSVLVYKPRIGPTLMRTGAIDIHLLDKKCIPSKPSIPLDNYLLDLIEDSDNKEASVYLNNVGWFVEDIWNDILPKDRTGKMIRRSITDSLGVCPSIIYAYKNNRKAISINMLYTLLLLWGKHCNKTNIEVEGKWQVLYKQNDWRLSTHSKHQKTMLPKKITPKLSYLMGWMVGDGHLKELHNYLIKISEKSVSQLCFVLRPLFFDLFGITAPLFRRYGCGYALQVGSKPVYRFMKNVLGLRVGSIPDIIWTFDNENKKYFLIGVFDSEGYVNTNYLDRRVTISQSDKNFLINIRGLFDDIGIKFNRPVKHSTKLGVWYSIQIRSKAEIVNFYYNCGSYHVDKRRSLTMLVNKIEKNRNR